MDLDLPRGSITAQGSPKLVDYECKLKDMLRMISLLHEAMGGLQETCCRQEDSIEAMARHHTAEMDSLKDQLSQQRLLVDKAVEKAQAQERLLTDLRPELAADRERVGRCLERLERTEVQRAAAGSGA